MIQNARGQGVAILVCPPCAKVQGYSEADLLEGVMITGSGAIHGLIKEGPATLSF
jgi:predicted peroxiredoxin